MLGIRFYRAVIFVLLSGCIDLEMGEFDFKMDPLVPPGECSQDAQCEPGLLCQPGCLYSGSTCVAGCLSDADCPQGELCRTTSLICPDRVGQCQAGLCHTDEQCPEGKRCHSLLFENPGECVERVDCGDEKAAPVEASFPWCTLLQDGSCGSGDVLPDWALCCPVVGRLYDRARGCVLTGADAARWCLPVAADTSSGTPACPILQEPRCFCDPASHTTVLASVAPSFGDLEWMGISPCDEELASAPECPPGP